MNLDHLLKPDSGHYLKERDEERRSEGELESANSSTSENLVNPNESDSEDDGLSTASSDLSSISCLSQLSGKEWIPLANSGPILWVYEQMNSGRSPRSILEKLIPGKVNLLPDDIDDFDMWRLIASLLNEPPRREKLTTFNTIHDVIQLIKSRRKIMVVTGAGVSVSCGIPDFRSKDGIYARLKYDFPELPDPQAMFDIHYFRRDPRPFFKFAKEIYPGEFRPSLSHKFIKLLETHGKLLRNYTQNIDTLEKVAGIERVITCHGSFATATCMRCRHSVDSDSIKDDVFEQRLPLCKKCPSNSDATGQSSSFEDSVRPIMKPDIVFFGEGLPEAFHSSMAADKDEADMLIVMGSSMKVRPVALIPNSIPDHIPQILINREPLEHLNFDIELLGDCDEIIHQLLNR